jgi:hypothetical protein
MPLISERWSKTDPKSAERIIGDCFLDYNIAGLMILDLPFVSTFKLF